MDRRIRILLIVVVVVALAYPAAAWLLGMSVEHQWQERERLLAEQVPYIEVVKSDYRRGVYSSTEEVTYCSRWPDAEGPARRGQVELERARAVHSS